MSQLARPLPDEPADVAWKQGDCWLWCQRRNVAVMWIGPATVAGLSAPMYGCDPCIRQLGERVWLANLRHDNSLPYEPHRVSRFPKFYPV